MQASQPTTTQISSQLIAQASHDKHKDLKNGALVNPEQIICQDYRLQLPQLQTNYTFWEAEFN